MTRKRTHIAAAFLLLSFTGAMNAHSASAQTFFNPTYTGYRLDFCKTFARDCGRPVANMYCRLRGYRGALSYGIAHDIGIPNSRRTRMIGSGHFCNASYCDGFRFIRCRR
jgi:hypothetical protein